MSRNTLNPIVWIDVETTGLSPVTDRLLQVASIITDPQGRVISDEFMEVIRHDRTTSYNLADGYVQQMHTKNGLWDRLETGTPLPQAEKDLLEFITLHAPEARRSLLGGNSVGFDRSMLQEHMPLVEEHLHYRNLDVSSLDYAFRAFGVTSEKMPKGETHDALEDIRESIAEYRWLMTRV